MDCWLFYWRHKEPHKFPYYHLGSIYKYTRVGVLLIFLWGQVTFLSRFTALLPTVNDWRPHWSMSNYVQQFAEKKKRGIRMSPNTLLLSWRGLALCVHGGMERYGGGNAGMQDGRMDGLLRGRWGITLKVSLHPRRKSAGQAADGFSRGWETWRLELLLIWRSQSCGSAVMSEPWKAFIHFCRTAAYTNWWILPVLVPFFCPYVYKFFISLFQQYDGEVTKLPWVMQWLVLLFYTIIMQLQTIITGP